MWILVQVVLLASGAQAQVDTRMLPEYTPCVVQGERFACYTAEQQYQLNLLEENAQHWKHRTELLDERMQVTDEILRINSSRISNLSIITEIQQRRIVALLGQLNTEIETKNKYRAEAESVDWWPLVIGGATLTVGIGVAIAGLVVVATR